MKCLKVEPEKLSTVLQKIETLISDTNDNLKFKIMLICEEAITNQTRHADFQGKKEDIEFCLDRDKDRITLLFKDNAKKFNPLTKEEPDITKSLEETQLGGLGIFMIKKYSKKLDFEYKDGYNLLKVEL